MHDIHDPNNATKPSFSREAFIGISAGAGILAGTGLSASAAVLTLGNFHDPIVPENDPAISIVTPELPRPGGAIRSYAAVPKAATQTTHGVVVVQHIWGVDASIRDVVRRFAKAGYVTIAPSLFSRLNAPSGDRADDYRPFRDLAAKLDDEQVKGDIEAGATWIRKRAAVDARIRPPKVGLTGFCMGGAIALRIAATSDAFDACAIWYGRVANEYAATLKIPMLGSYGARDTSIPAEGVREFQTKLHVPNDIKIYPEAGHAFFDDQRQSYVPSAAPDSWSRTLAWFGKYLP
ncbi:MAG: dienelactone hydrolase family protein [Candidatus Eremiobacter antarcticus]|nr:dienelactone hydrolase family protein [Candidatus Eremiobacteraeota bacterium]MBC5809003.1 dienelactone hydrolase family protein [Candidatus Eremiobacteraeota bacterium]